MARSFCSEMKVPVRDLLWFYGQGCTVATTTQSAHRAALDVGTKVAYTSSSDHVLVVAAQLCSALLAGVFVSLQKEVFHPNLHFSGATNTCY